VPAPHREEAFEEQSMAATEEDVRAALARVKDPEIRRPITELDMVDRVDVAPSGLVKLTILLTTAGCPLKDTISNDVTAAVRAVDGVTDVELTLGHMSDDQRTALKTRLRGGSLIDIPFAHRDSTTKVIAVASGKGGVGKSTVTVNLAAAMAAQGYSVGLLDADVYGFSVPRMMGITQRPTRLDDMILPPVAFDVKVISVGMFVQNNSAVVWRGPMLHRALEQFLGEVFWGDLDVLLLDLPPGTGDIAISSAQLVPSTELVVVTTPQTAAHEVAERAGSIAIQTRQKVLGVVENMSPMTLPDGTVLEMFGSGGGQQLAETLTQQTGTSVPLLGQVPLDMSVRQAGDDGAPLVLSQPDSPAGRVLRDIAWKLAGKPLSLAGKRIPLSVA
jgi:ATP-binding protein involved in chromosome partitioning